MTPLGAQSVNRPRVNLQHQNAGIFFYLVLIHPSPGGTDVIEMLNLTTYTAFESEIIYRGVTTENVFDCHIALQQNGTDIEGTIARIVGKRNNWKRRGKVLYIKY
jgi:hypothetical protein